MNNNYGNPVKKNEQYELYISGVGSNGEGIGRIDGFTLFVEGALPGDTVEVRVVKLHKQYGYGKLTRIVRPSPDRIEPLCGVFGKCGGCGLQHCDYAAELRYKTGRVADSLRRIGGLEGVYVPETIGMDNPYGYRNKGSFPVREIEGAPVIGFFSQRSHRIVPVSGCHIQHSVTGQALKTVKNFIIDNNIKAYDESTHEGLFRHVLIRVGFATGEVMVCAVLNGDALPHRQALIDALICEVPGIKSICISRNKEKTNTILGKTCEVIWGDGYITDFIGDLRFEISPLSFFQVNPIQTKILYETVLEFASLSPHDVVIDAYCGIGTISLFMARRAKKVYGVEAVHEAVADAIRNAALNNCANADFRVGMSETVIPQLIAEESVAPRVIVLDPPRKGCGEDLLSALISAGISRVVYVSCDPGTLSRDLKILSGGGYRVERVQPVDCFPRTPHVETVVLLQRHDT